MADGVFNIAKGRIVSYGTVVGTGNAALILVPLESSGLVADATMRDYDTLSDVLAGASNEQTVMGRKTVTACTVIVDDTNDNARLDIADQTWSSASGAATGKLLVCYDPDTTAGTDTAIVPLTYHDFTVTPDGNDVIATISASGFYSAS